MHKTVGPKSLTLPHHENRRPHSFQGKRRIHFRYASVDFQSKAQTCNNKATFHNYTTSPDDSREELGRVDVYPVKWHHNEELCCHGHYDLTSIKTWQKKRIVLCKKGMKIQKVTKNNNNKKPAIVNRSKGSGGNMIFQK